jgi:hypothetical protein
VPSGITVAGTPERGAVMQKVRELVEFARGQGYAGDELVEMIEDLSNYRVAFTPDSSGQQARPVD